MNHDGFVYQISTNVCLPPVTPMPLVKIPWVPLHVRVIRDILETDYPAHVTQHNIIFTSNNIDKNIETHCQFKLILMIFRPVTPIVQIQRRSRGKHRTRGKIKLTGFLKDFVLSVLLYFQTFTSTAPKNNRSESKQSTRFL